MVQHFHWTLSRRILVEHIATIHERFNRFSYLLGVTRKKKLLKPRMGTGAYRPPISKAQQDAAQTYLPSQNWQYPLVSPMMKHHPKSRTVWRNQEPRAKSQEPRPKLDTTKILAPLFRVNRWIMDAALNVAPPWNLTHIEALNKLSKWNNSTSIVQRTGTVLWLHLRKR